MLNTVAYSLKTTSVTDRQLNAEVDYQVYYDSNRGIAYEVELKVPAGAGQSPETAWHAKIVNYRDGKRLEYDILKRIYYQSRQNLAVEGAFYRLQEDLRQFMDNSGAAPVQNVNIGGAMYPGYHLNTLTIWLDPVRDLPLRRVNLDRGNVITDEFTYHSVNIPLPAEVFELEKPAEAIADFNLYPDPPMLPRFENVSEEPQEGIYVQTLLEEVKRHIILNQWEYGPFATIKLPWLTEMRVTIYRNKLSGGVPPLVVVFDEPAGGRTYFFVTYSYIGYVVTGFTQNPYDLSDYEQLPLTAAVTLRDLIPLYQEPSLEKEFVVQNFIQSVQSNDYIINSFGMGGKSFDIIVKNFSFHENEGYVILNIYGKEYWDNANFEAKFNYVVSGRMADAHITPLIIYAINSLKRLGIYERVLMPKYREIPD